jgi:hypothetical protein
LGFKDFVIRQYGKGYKNVEFLTRNKKWIGLAFGALGFYVWTQGCPGLESYCVSIAVVLTHLGSFLTGAGLLPSDYREKFVQGLIKKEEIS